MREQDLPKKADGDGPFPAFIRWYDQFYSEGSKALEDAAACPGLVGRRAEFAWGRLSPELAAATPCTDPDGICSRDGGAALRQATEGVFALASTVAGRVNSHDDRFIQCDVVTNRYSPCSWCAYVCAYVCTRVRACMRACICPRVRGCVCTITTGRFDLIP